MHEGVLTNDEYTDVTYADIEMQMYNICNRTMNNIYLFPFLNHDHCNPLITLR